MMELNVRDNCLLMEKTMGLSIGEC